MGVHGCEAGAVMVPSPESVETLSGRVEARLWWPATVSARMEREGDDVRYEVAMADALPQRWFAVGGRSARRASPTAILPGVQLLTVERR